MKAYLLLITLALTSLYPSTTLSQTHSFIHRIANIKEPNKQLEEALLLSQKLEKDTTLYKQVLTPLFDYAVLNKNIPLQWAFYMQMADGYSMAFDDTNPISDNYYKLANDLVKKNKNLELEIVGLLRQGYYNFVYRKVEKAFPYFLLANQLKPKAERSKIPGIIEHYQFAASFFNYINDNELAVKYLEESLPYSKQATRARINLINSLGLYNEKRNLKNEALKYFQEAKTEAQLAKDSVWIGIISGNLSRYSWARGNKEEAIQLTKQNIEYSTRFEEFQDAMRANLNLAKYYLSLSEWDLAETHIQKAQRLMKIKPYYLQYQMEAAQSLSYIAKARGQKIDELKHLNEYITLKDSLERRNDFQKLQNIVWQSEKEKFNRAMLRAEDSRLQTKRLFGIITAFAILLFCIILLLINKSKTRIKIKNQRLEKEQLTLSYEKQLVDQEVVILKNSLEDFTQSLKTNESIITQLRKNLAASEKESDLRTKSIQDNLNMMLDAHIMTDERWLKFRRVFDKVYPGYLTEMKKNYIKLTENDLKILALQKLDLNNNSMSELLCISLEGIKKAKHRLKKKMTDPNI